MRQMRASRATLASRGFITRAASALIFVGASALTLALPGDASENHGLTPSLSEWQNAGAPAPSEHWLGNDVGSFRLTGGDRLHDRILRTLQNRVHQEPERAAKELHGLIVGGSEGRDKLRQMLLNAAENKEMVTPLDIDNWWKSYYDRYLLDLADSSLNELLRYGEERMEARLGFVRNVNLEYRSPLGGRTGSGALSFLGAVSEYHDSALVWHLRAYHNEDKDTGGNIGFIYRRAYDGANLIAGRPALVGGNVYLDYQGHDAGEFLRYSLGGEVRTGAVDLYANYYIPLTDRQVYNGRTYYTAEGFDVEANVGVPGADWASAILGYYWFDDDDGRDPEGEQKGTKVGFRLRPTYEWEFELNYDIPEGNGNEEVGGRFSFNKRIGENADRHSSRPYGGDFNPRNHFFDIPRREYSQRIRSYGVAAMRDDPRLWWANNGTFENNAGGITDVNIAGAVVDNNAGVAEIAGVPVSTYYTAEVAAFLVTTIADVLTATVQINGGADGDQAAFVLGRVDNGPGEVTVDLIRGGGGALYVFDLDLGQVNVRHGAMVWDSIASPSWLKEFASEGITVVLSGTALSVNVPSDGAEMDAFALYEGRAVFSAGRENATDSTEGPLDCTDKDFAIPGAGRDPAGSFVTQCYGDIAIMAAGGMEFNGQRVADENEFPVFEEVQVVAAASGGMFVMRAGRDDSESVPVAITGAGTVAVRNDTDESVRFVRGEGGNFSIDGDAVVCDSGSGDVLVRKGGVVGYCPSGVTEYLNGLTGSGTTPAAGFIGEILPFSAFGGDSDSIRVVGGSHPETMNIFEGGVNAGVPGLHSKLALEPGATYRVMLEIDLGGTAMTIELMVNVRGNLLDSVPGAGIGNQYSGGFPLVLLTVESQAVAPDGTRTGEMTYTDDLAHGLEISKISGGENAEVVASAALPNVANETDVNTTLDPDGAEIPDGNYRDVSPLIVYDLPDEIEIVALINNTDIDATFPNGRGIANIGGLALVDAAFANVDDAGLVSIAYSAANNQISFGQGVSSLSLEGDNRFTVDVTAGNIRGTHRLEVNVNAVNEISIPSGLLVPTGDQNLGALAGYAGPVSWTSNGSAPNPSEVAVSYDIVGGADAGDFSFSGGRLMLVNALADGDEKVVDVEVTHTPVGTALEERLGYDDASCDTPPCFPNPNQSEINPVVLTVKLYLRTAVVTSPQLVEGVRSANPVKVGEVSFAAPTVSGMIPDFATGGTWAAADGQGTNGWAMIGSDGAVSGTPPDLPDPSTEYTDNLMATFSHDLLSGEADVRLDVMVVDRIPAAATVTFTPAGTNGAIAVRVTRTGEGGDGSVTLFTASPAVANFGDGIEVLAIPDPGYYVAAWLADSGADDSGCSSTATSKTGGTKFCSFVGVDDGDYTLGGATFTDGAISPNLPETGDVPAEDFGGWVSCLAFGGSLVSDAVSDACNGYTADSDGAANCVVGHATLKDCQGVYNAVRDCNNDRQPAASITDKSAGTVACGTTCTSPEIAVGGSCVNPAGVQVTYSNPNVAVFRIDGSRIASGENVASGALLSATATPAANNFVAGWDVDCENDVASQIDTLRFAVPGSSGNVDDTAAKFCLTRVTVNVDVDATIKPLPPVTYPLVPDTDAAFDAFTDAERTALCEGLGGTFGEIFFSDDSPAFTEGAECYGFSQVPTEPDTGRGIWDSCRMRSNSLGELPNCRTVLSTARECLAGGKVVMGSNGTVSECGGICPEGMHPLGGTCVQSLVGKGRFITADPLPIEDDAEKKKESGNKIRRSIGNSLSFPALPRQVDPPDPAAHVVLPPEILPEILQGNRAECEALGGRFNSAGSGFCLDVGTSACRIGRVCAGLFEQARTCHLDGNKKAATSRVCSQEVCENGLTAFGTKCVYQIGGVVQENVTTGKLPDIIPETGDLQGNRAECEAFGGRFNSAGSGFCLDVGTSACRIGRVCAGLFEQVRTCHLEDNEKGATNRVCGVSCLDGSIARGIGCVAPPPGGIQIGDPDNGVLRSTSHQDLAPGNNPLDDGQVVMLVATPTVGYHVAEWMGDCASVGTADPFRNTDQTCSVTKVAGTALNVNVRMSLGVLPDAVPVDGDIPDVPATLQAACGALGGSGVEVTLGVEYCYGYAEQEATLRDDDPPASVEGIGIKTQCWVAQGSYADTTRTDTVPDSTDTQMSVFDTFGGNRQLCRNALTHVRDCNKMNRPGLNNLETFRVDTSVVCPSSASTTGPEYCLPDNAGPGTGGTPNAMVCGAACEPDPVSGEQLLAVGGRCIPPGMVNNLPLYLTNL